MLRATRRSCVDRARGLCGTAAHRALVGGTCLNMAAQLPLVRGCIRPFITGLNTKLVFREMVELANKCFDLSNGNPPCCGGSCLVQTLNSRESESLLAILKDGGFCRSVRASVPDMAKEFHDYIASMSNAASDGGVDVTRDEFVVSWLKVPLLLPLHPVHLAKHHPLVTLCPYPCPCPCALAWCAACPSPPPAR